ncbi:MAG: M14 family metallopeptidase [Bacteroidota bacterium]
MKRLTTVLLSTLLLSACSTTTSRLGLQGETKLLEAFRSGVKLAPVSVKTNDPALLSRLDQAGMDIWGVRRDPHDRTLRIATGTMTESQYKLAKQLGMTIGYLSTVRPENTVDPRYHDYREMLEEMRNLAARYPSLARLVDLGDSWEKTQGKADRDIWALRIGKGAPAELDQKPALLFMGEHHAREIASSEISLFLLKHLLENYGKDAEVTQAVDGRDIWIVPMVNPDGFELAMKGSDWRKNTNISAGGTLSYGGGVDVNRNYGFSWDKAGGSTSPTHPTYRGTKPFSEPETQAIRDLVVRRKPIFLMSFHSYSNVILWPWGYSNEPPKDKRLPAIGKKLASLAGYAAEQSCDLYIHGGILNDWAYGELGLLPFTTEIGSEEDGFDPPYAKMDQYWKENKPGMMYLLKIADNPDQAL